MFHVFIESNVDKELVCSFAKCFTNNCQCVINEEPIDVYIEIIHSVDDRNYLYSEEISDIFKQELGSRNISTTIINTLPEYADKTILDKIESLKCPTIVILESKNKTNHDELIEFVCFCVFKFFHINSLLEPISFREIDELIDTRKVINKNFSIVTNSKGNKFFTKNIDRDAVDHITVERSIGSDIFYVRRRFTDLESEKLATRDLQKAVTECNKHTGYHIYDNNGKAIYQSVKNKIVVNNNRLNVQPTETAIVRSGNSVRLKSQSGKYATINDGEIIQISKRLGNKIEIFVFKNGEQYKAFVNSDVLANF